MTQGALAEAIYGDKKHSPNIYAALKSMVDKGIIVRTESNPSYYSLSDVVAMKIGLIDITNSTHLS